MGMIIAAGILAVILFIIFSAAIALKLKEVSLTIVILIGVLLVATNRYQLLISRDE